ncbi:MAG: glycosyltransferase [Bacteroidales bacterium]|nr:glycosyltransferase [Bacteroidales bacterium]
MADDNQLNNISLFIFMSNARGMQYGIGTYIHELTQALLRFPEINIFLIKYYSIDIKEFSIKTISERFIEINIPASILPINQNNRCDKKYAASITKLITDIIPKKGHKIFQFNIIDDFHIIQKIKKFLDFPIISIVHLALWQRLFEGNWLHFTKLNIDNPTNSKEYILSQEREMYRQSDHIVSVTRYMKEFLINEYSIRQDKISVIKNGLNHNKYDFISKAEKIQIKRKYGFEENEIIILFSGRIDPCKGIFFLMEAFEEACKKNKNLRLVLMGQGSIQDCQKKIQSFFGKVTYTGFLPKETVTSFYKIADIGISPSVYDHCPYTVLEMMANHIPLILSRTNGLDELLSDDKCLFINPIISSEGDISFNCEELSDAILTLAADKDLRTRLAENSYRSFDENYTASRMAKEMYNIFHTIINRKNTVTEYEKSERR